MCKMQNYAQDSAIDAGRLRLVLPQIFDLPDKLLAIARIWPHETSVDYRFGKAACLKKYLTFHTSITALDFEISIFALLL
jgi:hypothetical protein